ncbi:hypothetical protein P8452_66488 [Trifolium repens]|nr:hypothetical protein P8452_66488 [Trifolium repens]
MKHFMLPRNAAARDTAIQFRSIFIYAKSRPTPRKHTQTKQNSVLNFTVTSSPSHHLLILSNASLLLTLSSPIILSRQHLFPVSRVSNLVLTGYKVGYDLNGERMPELRSGARRSKWLGDLQTGLGKGSSPAVPTRRTAAGRGCGARLIDLDPEPCEVLPEFVALRAEEPVYNHVEVVANNNILMEGVSGDKAAAAE